MTIPGRRPLLFCTLLAFAGVCQAQCECIWEGSFTDVQADTDLVMVPGGFSYGDYLRTGAMAANSPVISQLHQHAERGGYILGVCNGFQILCETGLLPGAPNPWSGSVVQMSPDRVEPLELSMPDAARHIRQLGRGFAGLKGGSAPGA